MLQCAVAHEMADGFRLREVLSADAAACIRARQIVPTAHAFAAVFSKPLRIDNALLLLEKLVPRVLKYCNRGFALPTAWQRPFVREVIESALRSDELPSLRFQLKRLRSLLSQEASCRCALARQHTHATFVAT